MSPRVLLLLAVTLLASACAHPVTLLSEPPGAEVYVDGERVGTTPYTLQEITGEPDSVTVELRHDGVSARFGVLRTAWAVEPLFLSLGVLLGGMALASLGSLIGALSAVIAPVALPLAIGFFVATFAAQFVVIAGTAVASWGPFFVAGLFGRESPDTVKVDFRTGEITSSPGGYIEPLVGTPAGYRPLLRRREDDD